MSSAHTLTWDMLKIKLLHVEVYSVVFASGIWAHHILCCMLSYLGRKQRHLQSGLKYVFKTWLHWQRRQPQCAGCWSLYFVSLTLASTGRWRGAWHLLFCKICNFWWNKQVLIFQCSSYQSVLNSLCRVLASWLYGCGLLLTKLYIETIRNPWLFNHSDNRLNLLHEEYYVRFFFWSMP